jgi:hypothetical protein
MALWIELLMACEDAYAVDESEDRLQRFYDYARWCWQSEDADTRGAVACAFYEHLPLKPVMRADMPRRFTPEQFADLHEVFRYHLSPSEAGTLEREFLEGRERFERDERHHKRLTKRSSQPLAGA